MMVSAGRFFISTSVLNMSLALFPRIDSKPETAWPFVPWHCAHCDARSCPGGGAAGRERGRRHSVVATSAAGATAVRRRGRGRFGEFIGSRIQESDYTVSNAR